MARLEAFLLTNPTLQWARLILVRALASDRPTTRGTRQADVGAAPIAELPHERAAQPRKKSGWNSTDFIVVLLALGVLALSAVGLYWLLRG